MNVGYYFAMWGKSAHGFMQHPGADVHTPLELTGRLDASMLSHGITLAE